MIPHERSLVKRLEGKPFALLGINSDQDRSETRKRCRDEGITWRSWFNGNTRDGIAAAWGVRAWPTIYVLDHKGVIRFKGVRGEAMDRAVDELLAELQKSGGK
jgi:hypothetical protein